jgi:hypothetical protein
MFTDRAFLIVCRPGGGVTGELLTLPRSSSPVRCGPSMQLGGSCSSADVAAGRHKSERLAVNLAVNQPLHCCGVGHERQYARRPGASGDITRWRPGRGPRRCGRPQAFVGPSGSDAAVGLVNAAPAVQPQAGPRPASRAPRWSTPRVDRAPSDAEPHRWVKATRRPPARHLPREGSIVP